jgi:adenylate cyclase
MRMPVPGDVLDELAGATARAELAAAFDMLGAGVALADPDTLDVQLENRQFTEWFPARADVDVLSRIGAGDRSLLDSRIARGRPYRVEIELQRSIGSVHLLIELRPIATTTGTMVLVEAVNIGRQKEAEYMLDSYSRMVERQTRALEQEKERVEKLLLNIMPRRVYEELKDFGTTTPQSFPSASVLMLDFVGFTEMALSRDPGALIAELNDVFTSFDRIVEHFRCERIKTIGDAYMAVAGLPDPDPDHDHNLARAALRMRSFLRRRNTSHTNQWQCRIGIGRGPIIGSIVGIQKYVYDIFGPAVNLAARLEHVAEAGMILLGPETSDRIRDDFVLTSIGEVEIKGFGVQSLYALEDEARKGRRA